MTIIIGGRDSILSQIPKEVRKQFPRLASPLTGEEVEKMIEQSILILNDKGLQGSQLLFCDVLRLCMALQLAVSESRFGGQSAMLQKYDRYIKDKDNQLAKNPKKKKNGNGEKGIS